MQTTQHHPRRLVSLRPAAATKAFERQTDLPLITNIHKQPGQWKAAVDITPWRGDAA